MRTTIRIDKVNYPITAWTGGSTAPKGFYHGKEKVNKKFRRIVSYFFQQSLVDCCGLDYWKFVASDGAITGTSSLERARIFWNRAKGDAWATMREIGEVK